MGQPNSSVVGARRASAPATAVCPCVHGQIARTGGWRPGRSESARAPRSIPMPLSIVLTIVAVSTSTMRRGTGRSGASHAVRSQGGPGWAC
eukprot:scaffold9226_cov37-Tisochrysis_lutea.AAC.3